MRLGQRLKRLEARQDTVQPYPGESLSSLAATCIERAFPLALNDASERRALLGRLRSQTLSPADRRGLRLFHPSIQRTEGDLPALVAEVLEGLTALEGGMP